ncbi:MAG: polyprenyl synthetase family protein [Candidatus Omnitrophota bacterium]
MIDVYLSKINRGIKDILDQARRRYKLRQVSDHLFAFTKEFVLRKGKRIRPLLFILSYKGYAARPTTDESGLFISAASIELLHDYMLIHDDVIDKSQLRRGKPTLHKMFDRQMKFKDGAKIGEELAIVAGDILFALAIESFTTVQEDLRRKEKTLKKLVETAAFTGAGEFIDVVSGHQSIDELTEKKILLNYTLKTARYTFECPLLMGALLAGAPAAEQNKLSSLGLASGQAFQIYDDMLDLFASEKVIGKPVLTDLNESKKTLLIFRAYQRLSGTKRRSLRQILEKENKTLTDLKELRALIVESGSYESCLKIMTNLQNKALGLCRDLRMETAHKKMLCAVIEKLSPSRMPLELPRKK